MKKEGKENVKISDLYGNIKNQFRNENLSILREMTFFRLGLLFVLVQSNLDIVPLFFFFTAVCGVC